MYLNIFFAMVIFSKQKHQEAKENDGVESEAENQLSIEVEGTSGHASDRIIEESPEPEEEGVQRNI